MRLHYDPNDYYVQKGATLETVKEACGILPQWAIRCDSMAVKASEAMRIQYAFFWGWNECDEEWDIDDKGVFKFEGDDDQQPFCTIETNDEYVYIYPSAMVGVVDKETKHKKYSRFD